MSARPAAPSSMRSWSYQGRVRLKVFVDNVLKFEDYYSCTYCHSKDPVWVLNVNQYTGDVIRRY